MRIKTGEDYERAMCRQLKKRGFRRVRMTAVSGDHGVDILADKKGVHYAIQCKYYSYPVGNHAVQEVYTGCAFYECDVPVVLTNNVFTVNAKKEAARIGVELWQQNRIPFARQSLLEYIGFALPGVCLFPVVQWLFNPLTAQIFGAVYFAVWFLLMLSFLFAGK